MHSSGWMQRCQTCELITRNQFTMERRENVLKEALADNANETERWQAFKAENDTAIKNLEMFSKHLTVEVMVPIGKKALMPGELIHTNELLVGHYQGYFSSCSAHKAIEICQHRLRLAEDRLNILETEADLWQNKLSTPLLQGAMPDRDQIEIVEEYNEEEHNQWLIEHKKRMQKENQKERAKHETVSNVDVFKQLEEREMMEELGLDPDSLDEETLSKMLAEYADITPKIDNVAKNPTEDCDINSAAKNISDKQVFDLLEKLESEEQNELSDVNKEMQESLKSTNNMVSSLMHAQIEESKPKQRISKVQNGIQKVPAISDGVNDEENDDDDEIPEEVQIIRKQVELMASEERVPFLSLQLQLIRAKMRKLQAEQCSFNETSRLIDVVVCLEDDLQELIIEQSMLTDDVEDPTSEDEPEIIEESTGSKKRRISFALSEEKLEFRQNETVAEMMPKNKQHYREIVSLDAPLQLIQTPAILACADSKPQNSVNPDLLQKVNSNLEFVKETQSVQDFNLIDQILEASTGQIKTLHINFTHSKAVPATAATIDVSDIENIPGTPADFYVFYEQALAQNQQNAEFPIYVNSFEGEEQVKVPILSEAAREAAYDDPRSQFSKPISEIGALEIGKTKSILRNKSAVEQEPHKVENKSQKNRKKQKKKKERTVDDTLRDMSAYQKVMHDLVEKEEPTAPEPLPKGKYIDAHTPKKRISRFKEQRILNKT